ncbi:hypothetical protein EDB85DRAFT_1968574 [Lactarius pseudohatsudake]|nr:hypothetical protein EDB85DRAFT_1968574 [Lactarius pseudohatsudake]
MPRIVKQVDAASMRFWLSGQPTGRAVRCHCLHTHPNGFNFYQDRSRSDLDLVFKDDAGVKYKSIQISRTASLFIASISPCAKHDISLRTRECLGQSWESKIVNPAGARVARSSRRGRNQNRRTKTDENAYVTLCSHLYGHPSLQNLHPVHGFNKLIHTPHERPCFRPASFLSTPTTPSFMRGFK